MVERSAVNKLYNPFPSMPKQFSIDMVEILLFLDSHKWDSALKVLSTRVEPFLRKNTIDQDLCCSVITSVIFSGAPAPVLSHFCTVFPLRGTAQPLPPPPSVMMFISFSGDVSIDHLRTLVRHGADVSSPYRGSSCLPRAALLPRGVAGPVINLLLEAGADPLDSSLEISPLVIAVANDSGGAAEAVRALLGRGGRELLAQARWRGMDDSDPLARMAKLATLVAVEKDAKELFEVFREFFPKIWVSTTGLYAMALQRSGDLAVTLVRALQHVGALVSEEERPQLREYLAAKAQDDVPPPLMLAK